MNQKGFLTILITVLAVVVIAGIAGYFTFSRKLESVKTTTASPTSNNSSQPKTISPTQTSHSSIPVSNTTSDQAITSSPPKLTGVASESRKRFIEAGLTEEYFDKHFKLKDTTDRKNSTGQPIFAYVYWIYEIGGYKIDDIVDTISYIRPNDPLAKQHNIEKVLTLKDGVDKLSSCLEKPLTEKDVLVFYEYRSEINGRVSGLYLSGTGNVHGSAVVQGELNLESGKCDIHESTIQF